MYPTKQIEIKKTKEVPHIGSGRNRYRFPLDELEVDDYFEVLRSNNESSLPRPKCYSTLCNVRSHVTYYKRTEEGRNKDFACRQVIGDNESEYPGKEIVVCIRIK